MQTLRNARRIACFVLAWFVLSLGVAAASPLVKPQGTQMVCSGAGVMMVMPASDDGSTGESIRLAWDCPLCVGLSAPPPPMAATVVPPVQPLSYALQGIPRAHIAARTAASLPARGPPEL